MTSRQQTSRSFGLILIVLAWAAFLVLIGSPVVLLFTAPLFLMAAPLALGKYVGEELIEKLADLVGSASRKSPRKKSGEFQTVLITVPGSRLISLNLAGRAPPAAFA